MNASLAEYDLAVGFCRAGELGVRAPDSTSRLES
jgi:hypothetical protein